MATGPRFGSGGRNRELSSGGRQPRIQLPDIPRPKLREISGGKLGDGHTPADYSRPTPAFSSGQFERQRDRWAEARDRLAALRADLETRRQFLRRPVREQKSAMEKLQGAAHRVLEWLELARGEVERLSSEIDHLRRLEDQIDGMSEDYIQDHVLPHIAELARSARESFPDPPLVSSELDVGQARELPGFSPQDWDFFREGERRRAAGRYEQAFHAGMDRAGDAAIGMDTAVDRYVRQGGESGQAPITEVELTGSELAPDIMGAPLKTSKVTVNFGERSRRGEAGPGREHQVVDLFYNLDRLFSDDSKVRADATEALFNDGVVIRGKEYQVIDVIGRGGVGVALEVVERGTGRRLVMKLTRPVRRNRMTMQEGGFGARSQLIEVAALHKLTKGERRRRARAGAEPAADLPVAEFVRAFQFTFPGADRRVSTALIMERVEGRPLSYEIKHGNIEFSRLKKILQGVVAAVMYMHEREIYHRDLKPGNIMVQDDGGVKFIDMGMAMVAQLLRGQLSKLDSTSGPVSARVVGESGIATGPQGSAAGSIQLEIVDNRWVRKVGDNRSDKPPVVYALPEVGSAYGTLAYMPNCELLRIVAEELEPQLRDPVNSVGLADRLVEVARRRDLYAVGAIIDRLARKLYPDVQDWREQRMVDILFWISARVLNEYEMVDGAGDPVSIEEIALVLDNLDSNGLWYEAIGDPARNFVSQVGIDRLVKLERIRDVETLGSYKPVRTARYIPSAPTASLIDQKLEFRKPPVRLGRVAGKPTLKSAAKLEDTVE